VAYTFGAATGDDITWTESASNYGSSARSSLVCGWWYPTTGPTATRCLWSFGTVNRCAIATTSTSEISLFLNRTTPSQHTTSGLGLAVNRWHFIAVLGSFFNTGVVTNYRVWRGVDAETPSLVTVNVTTAGAGNSTGSTVATIGNAGSAGTVAFEGQIGRFDFVTAVTADALCRNGTGLISAGDEFAIYTQMVIPIWQGRMPTFYGSGTQSNNGITHTVVDLDNGAYGRTIRNGGTIITMDRGVTVSGATVSANRASIGQMRPVAWPDHLRR
jgi:hypothetical protein